MTTTFRDTSRRRGCNPSTRRPLVIRDLKFPLKRAQSNSIKQGHNVDAGSKILMETNAHIYFETGPAGYKGSVVLKRGLSISNDRTIYIRIVLPWVLQKTRLFPPAREKEQEKVLCISGDWCPSDLRPINPFSNTGIISSYSPPGSVSRTGFPTTGHRL